MKIILIGFMSSGKTTVAKELAERLGYQLGEMDNELVARSGYESVAKIFELKGEPFFRDLETQVAESHRNDDQCVISTGGGTPMRRENMNALKSGDSFTVFLRLDFETILQRIGDVSSRPLFKDGRSAAELYQKRIPIYESYADIVVDSNKSPAKIVDEIITATQNKFRCVVIGDPIAHSLSPRMHSAGYQALGIENRFQFDHHQVSTVELMDFINLFRKFPYRGAACSMPHKEALVTLVDQIDPVAEKIGAINTLLRMGNKIAGYNTDWLGIVNPLKRFGDLAGKKVLILGAGGAARAAIVGTQQCGATVTVCNRTAEKSSQFARQFNIAALDWSKRLESTTWDIIVNTTSVGMKPNEHLSPLEGFIFKDSQIVFETIYNPRETQLLRDAKKAHANTIDGLEMLLAQGLAQFEIFTGKPAPEAAMRAALMQP